MNNDLNTHWIKFLVLQTWFRYIRIYVILVNFFFVKYNFLTMIVFTRNPSKKFKFKFLPKVWGFVKKISMLLCLFLFFYLKLHSTPCFILACLEILVFCERENFLLKKGFLKDKKNKLGIFFFYRSWSFSKCSIPSSNLLVVNFNLIFLSWHRPFF